MGHVVQAGAKMNPARQAAIRAGLPVSVPAMTVNRVCSAVPAQAIVSASHEIMSAAVKTAVAGGMENMDLAPYLIARGRWGYRMGDGHAVRRPQRCVLGSDGAGTPRIWSANFRSAVRHRTGGRYGRSSASPRRRLRASSRTRSLPSTSLAARVRRSSQPTSIVRLRRRLRRWRHSLVVDLGCGTGRFSELLAAHLGALVISIDPSQKMIVHARRKRATGSVLFQRAAAEGLPLADGCVDLVFMSQAYHHVTDAPAVARECRRVLREGGYVCIRNTVESGCGAVVLGRPCRLPPLSSGGALVGRP
jgi:hypothetical protein